ncbi:GT4 family glycosyltransferase PelF [Bhargavaea ullalensis]|uniref:Glycosyltransferase involved in cell wall biosynthesis n=1 Tax=Bhargavaea ullalensis TaxID=1265685 RepID=A0ABV2GEB8_9BACL
MKVGIVAEGSYPFVSGGVASWIQTMMKQMPEHQFVIYAIVPRHEPDEEMKYELPDNVAGVEIIPLEKTETVRKRSEVKLTAEECGILEDWFSFRSTGAGALKILQDRSKVGSGTSFLDSEVFYSIVKSCYRLEDGSASFLDYLWMMRAMYKPVLALLQEELPEVDLVHAVSTGYGGLLGSVLSMRFGCPLILTEHGLYTREREEEIIQADWIPPICKDRWIRFFRQLSEEAYGQAHRVISLFERNRAFQLEGGASPDSLEVVPNGVDLSVYENLRKPRPEERMVIVSVLRVVPIKDVKTMIYSAWLLKKRGVPFEFHLVGPRKEDPLYAEECAELIARLELSDEVFLTGPGDVQAYLRQADVLVLTSISEGQPLAMLEGMAAGIPWVTTDVGSCKELIEGTEADPFGPCGFCVPPVSPEAVADRLAWFFDHPEQLHVYGDAGRERIRAYYQLHEVVWRYQQIYLDAAGKRRETHGGNRVPAAENV